MLFDKFIGLEKDVGTR